MGVRCSLCGRTFRTAQGRRGHLNFYHGLARDTPFTKAIRWNIKRTKDGVKKLEEEKIKDRTKREERREKAISALRRYERSMAAETAEDNRFIDEVEIEAEDTKFIDEIDMRAKDSKFVNKVEFV